MTTHAAAAARELNGPGLVEARRLHWRKPASEYTLRRDGRRWTLWTAMVVVAFGAPAALLVALDAWLFPVAILLITHGALICRLQAGRAAKSVVPLRPQPTGTEPRVGGDQVPSDDAEGIALGLLGDLLAHPERELMQRRGLALQQGQLGVWLLGERGALLVRPGGRRVFAFCVRVGESDDLPAADRVAHLLLALREDEEGFATVANLGFSGAVWRCRMRMGPVQRPALEAAVAAARRMRTAA